jgi:peptide/nickel transport system substrate-binding protein
MFQQALITRSIGRQVFESLVVRNESRDLSFDLATGVDISPDGLTYTFPLRRGVKFHDGRTMTSADVAASFERYRLLANNTVLNPVERWETPDDHTFVLKLKEPTASLLESMSSFNSLLVVMPADTATEPNDQNFKPIGTGPFKLVEWVPDSHVKLERFADYVANDEFEGLDGLGGRKQACVDTITMRIVTEPAARIAGLETGEFDIVDDVPFGAADTLQGLSEVSLVSLKHWWNHHVQTNLQEPPTDRLEFRQAVQALLDMDAIMEIATDGAYDTHPGWLFPGQTFYSDVGAELYNQKNVDLAKELLVKAGYNGEKVVIATNSTYDTMYKAALVMSEQMRSAGINVELSVTDWATQLKRRKGPGYNYWTGGWPLPASGPVQGMSIFAHALNFNNLPEVDAELEAAWQDLNRADTDDKIRSAVERMQRRVYDQAYLINFGTMDILQGTRSNVKGFVPFPNFRFWNVWLEN